MSIEAFSCPNCGSSRLEQSEYDDQFKCLHCGTASYYIPSLNILTLSIGTTCANCGLSNSVVSRFCSSCGSGLFERCGYCRSEIPHGQVYCPVCGEFLGGIPRTSVDDVKQLVNSIVSRYGSPIFASISHSADFFEKISRFFEPDEEFLWGFNPPPDERTCRESGFPLYVIVNDLMCFGGVFIATSEGFYIYSPEIPEERGFLSSDPGQPSIQTRCRYEVIASFTTGWEIPFPQSAALKIYQQYPKDYQSPYPHDFWRIITERGDGEDALSIGFEIRSMFDETIRLVQLLGSWPRLQEWERLLRFTLGIERSDLEYQPSHLV